MPVAQQSPPSSTTSFRNWNVVLVWMIGIVAVGSSTLLRAAEPSTIALPAAPAKFLDQHCLACHRGAEAEGKLQLDQLSADFSDSKSLARWQKILKRVQTGEMPPKDEPRPEKAAVQEFTAWLREQTEAAETKQRTKQGRTVLRRLNRVEYENTINDLLGIQIPITGQLPADGAANGFDNSGAALHSSAFLMEKYLEAAESALNAAICNDPQAPKSTTQQFDLKECHPIRNTQEKVYRFLEDGTVICFCSSEWHNVSVSKFYPSARGLYRFRLKVSAVQSADKPVVFRLTAGPGRLSGKAGLVGYFDAPPNESRTIEFVRQMEAKTTIALLPYGLANAQTVTKVGGDNWTGPGLAIHEVEIEGPLHEQWPPTSHRLIFGDQPRETIPGSNNRNRVEVVTKDPAADAKRLLMPFARRAFRRVVTPDEIQPYCQIVAARLATGATFEQAMRAALKGILLSPEFLFLRESPGRLDNAALANRLSYFLWSTMPDDELLELAAQGAFITATKGTDAPSHNEVLRAQVERMLQSPRAAALTENFLGQWLGLREIDATEPSFLLYPEFDHQLKVAMLREPELFFEDLLRRDGPIRDFIAADYTFLNGRLAKHYGIPDIQGWEFQRVKLPAESHRGGILTMAAIAKITANGTITSPVLRGAWVLDRILGQPAPPPPPNTPVIDPDIRGATTIREQLAKHRTTANCAVCHVKIDPPGFALESFDCIGGWRENYRVTGNGKSVTIDGRRMPYHEGKPVDPSDVMPDGTKFSNIDEFKQLLLRDEEQIIRALAIKLLTYATGEKPTDLDQPEIERLVSKVRKQGGGLRTLIHEVVQSPLFLEK